MAENKTAPRSFVKDGVSYFVRRVPKDLRHHYISGKISCSLRAMSVSIAASRALRKAQRLDEHWYRLRVKDIDLPGKHMLRLAQDVTGSVAFPPLVEVVCPSIGAFDAATDDVRERGFSDFARGVGGLRTPCPEAGTEAVRPRVHAPTLHQARHPGI